jgi:hypothetical protein
MAKDEFPLLHQENIRREDELRRAAEADRSRIEHDRSDTMAAQEAQGRAQALAIIGTLPPLYNRRAEIAAVLAPILADFWRCEHAIRVRENDATNILHTSRRFADTPDAPQQVNQLRAQVGLPDKQDAGMPIPTNDAELLARSVVEAITGGYLTPGAIVLPGGKGMNFNFDR